MVDTVGVAWQAVHVAQNIKTVRTRLFIVLPTISPRRFVRNTAIAVSTIRTTRTARHAVGLGVFKDNTSRAVWTTGVFTVLYSAIAFATTLVAYKTSTTF